MRKLLKKFFKYLGYEIIDSRYFDPAAQNLTSKSKYLWLNDRFFNDLYEEALKATGTDSFIPHKVRSYTLIQLLQLIVNKFKNYPVQHFAECGVLRGMTVYEFCSILERSRKLGTNVTFHAFDSYRGLSPRQKEDVTNELAPEKSLPDNEIGTGKGSMTYSLEEVQNNLKKFDFIEYHKGWIPESFKGLPEKKYIFVHVDVDVYQPTIDAFEYFYPRLVDGGVIICDDYGFISWPGAQKAVEEFGRKYKEPILRLTTGQAVIIKGVFQTAK